MDRYSNVHIRNAAGRVYKVPLQSFLNKIKIEEKRFGEHDA